MNYKQKSICTILLLILTYHACQAEPQQRRMVQGANVQEMLAVQWANRGIELFDQGDYEASIEAFFEAWKLSSGENEKFKKNLSAAYNNYAKQLASMKQFTEAVNMLRRAIFFQPNNSVAAQNLDQLLQRQDIDPQDAQTRLKEARKLRSLGKVEESMTEYRKAIELLQENNKSTHKPNLELLQVYQVIYAKYAKSPISKQIFTEMAQLALKITKQEADDPRPHILLGRAYMSTGRLPQAIKSFENALELDYQNQDAQYGLISAWRKVLEISPKEPENLIGLGNALIRAGEYKEGKEYLKKAKQLAPEDMKIDAIIATSDKLESEDKSFYLAEQGLRAQKAGDLSRAITYYEQAIQELPQNPEAANVYYNLGLAYIDRRMFEDAKKVFEKAQDLNPDNPNYQAAIAKVNRLQEENRDRIMQEAISLQEQGKLQQAFSKYRMLLENFPQDAQAHFNLGTAYQQAEQLQDALTHYSRAEQLEPNNPEYRDAVMTIRNAIGNGNIIDSKNKQVLKEAIRLQKSGDYREAIDKYQQVLKAAPHNAQAKFNLATAYHAKGELKEAILTYREAYAESSNAYPEANYYVAVLMESMGRSEDAIPYYEQYLQDTGEDGEFTSDAQKRLQVLKATANSNK